MLLQQSNSTGRRGHTTHQKILVTPRHLARGLSFRQLDDMVRMSPESQRQAFYSKCNAIYSRYPNIYLNRQLTNSELESIAEAYAEDRFPGFIGAVDCMHLHWKNCPKAYKGQYHNPKDGMVATISCEALCYARLYCWSWFAGRCGNNNDITVIDRSPLFIDILNGRRKITLENGYELNGQRGNRKVEGKILSASLASYKGSLRSYVMRCMSVVTRRQY